MAVLEKFTEMCDEFKLAHSKQISWQKTKRDNSFQLCDGSDFEMTLRSFSENEL